MAATVTNIDRLAALPAGTTVALCGRAVQVDDTGSLTLVRDATGQALVFNAIPIAIGAWVRAEGAWRGDHLAATNVVVLNQGRPEATRADSDFTKLGPRLANLRARHKVLQAIRTSFDTAGFLEVETPAIVACPGLDVHLDALEVLGAGGPRWLHTSPEYQMKRLLSAGLTRIYQLGKAFRRGELGSRHEPEFTMLEWYEAFSDADGLMNATERLVHEVAVRVNGTPIIERDGQRIDLTPPWDRLTVADAFERYSQVSLPAALLHEDEFFRVLAEDIEPKLGAAKPVFLMDYPASMASLARLRPLNPEVAERFEAYVAGIELCNGFGELTDATEQRSRLALDQRVRAQQGKAVYPLDERFLDALADGIPPCAGNALGVDRLVMLLTGATHIEDVIAFGAKRA